MDACNHSETETGGHGHHHHTPARSGTQHHHSHESCSQPFRGNMWTACIYGDEQRLKELLSQGRDASTADEYGYTGLHLGAQAGHLNIVMELLRAGANVDAGLRGSPGCTPLLRAAHNGHTDICRLLLEKGAAVNARDCSTGDMRTPLCKAASMGHPDTVSLLLRFGADPRMPDSRGEKPWAVAARAGFADLARQLAALDDPALVVTATILAASAVDEGHISNGSASFGQTRTTAPPPGQRDANESAVACGTQCRACGASTLAVQSVAGCSCRVCESCAVKHRRRAPGEAPRPCCANGPGSPTTTV